MVTRNRTRTAINASKREEIRRRYAKYAPDLASTNKDLGRSESRKKILIVCEGEKTEPNYFNWLKRIWRVNAEIEILGRCGDPLNVVKRAVQEKAQRKRETKPDSVFAVFDRDDFTLERINHAYRLAESNGIQIAFSNEAFELWYLLHFQYIDAALAREELRSKLEERIGKPYLKNDTSIFTILADKILSATRNARRLEACNDSTKDNPYTSVHWLILEFALAAAVAPDIKDTTEAIASLFHPSSQKP